MHTSGFYFATGFHSLQGRQNVPSPHPRGGFFCQSWKNVSFLNFPKYNLARDIVLSFHAKYHAPKFPLTSPPFPIKYPQQWHCERLGSITWQIGVINYEAIWIHTDGLSLWWRLELCGTFMCRDTVCKMCLYFVVQNKWSQALINLSISFQPPCHAATGALGLHCNARELDYCTQEVVLSQSSRSNHNYNIVLCIKQDGGRKRTWFTPRAYELPQREGAFN